jgi:hypothetical protein
MKKQLLTIALIFFGVQFAKAVDLYCGASIETVNGSAIYNKQLFLEKVTENKSTIRYLLDDGSILTVSSGQIFDSTPIKDGDLMIVISKITTEYRCHLQKYSVMQLRLSTSTQRQQAVGQAMILY